MVTVDPLVDSAIGQFGRASGALLEARALMQQRIDRKYLLPERLLQPLFLALRADHHIVSAAGHRVARYHTLYFDTPDRLMYHDHRRGRRPRYKVRLRHHLDRRCSFLEVKSKRADDRTTKARLALPFQQTELSAEARQFIDTHCPIAAATLAPGLMVTFHRVSLLSVLMLERVTVDWHLVFHHEHRSVPLSGVAIAEIKQGRYSNANGASRIFRELNVREERMSKYGVGTACFTPLSTSGFKPVFRTLRRLGQCCY